MATTICRIGVFYDGSYFGAARKFFRYKQEVGWLFGWQNEQEVADQREETSEVGASSK